MKRTFTSKMILVKKDDQDDMDKQLGITEERITEALNHLKDWYSKQPHLPQEYPPDDTKLIGLLIRNSFSLELTKVRLDVQYSIRSVVPEMSFAHMYNTGFKCIMDSVPYVTLRNISSKDQSRISIVTIKQIPDTFDIIELLIYGFMLAEYRVYTDYTTRNRFIVDLANLKISHLAKLNPSSLKKCEEINKRVSGVNVTGIHVLNPPPFLDKLFFIVKQILKPKISNRIKIHHTLEQLYEDVSQEILPKNYGGQENTIDELLEEWKNEFFSDFWRKKFMRLDKMKSDETKRLNQSFEDNYSNYIINGSFRKLCVD